jgi:hypothetical protein
MSLFYTETESRMMFVRTYNCMKNINKLTTTDILCMKVSWYFIPSYLISRLVVNFPLSLPQYNSWGRIRKHHVCTLPITELSWWWSYRLRHIFFFFIRRLTSSFESFGLLNDVLPCCSILYTGCPIFNVHLTNILRNIVFPSLFGPSFWSCC